MLIHPRGRAFLLTSKILTALAERRRAQKCGVLRLYPWNGVLGGTKVFTGLPCPWRMTKLCYSPGVTKSKLVKETGTPGTAAVRATLQPRETSLRVHQPCSAEQDSSCFAKGVRVWARMAASTAEKNEDYPS